MGKRENFTAERVAKFQLEPDKQQSLLWDAKTPGLGLRATAGSKSFIFETRLNGKTLRITIGDVRTWTVGKAQAEATRLKAMTDQGIDPRQEKLERIAAAEAKRQEARRAEVTVGEAWQDYVAARSHKWGERHRRDHERAMAEGGQILRRGRQITPDGKTAPGMLRPLAGLRLADLDRSAVAGWLKQANERGATEAAKHYRLLRAFVAWCAESEIFAGLVQANACYGSAVRDHVKPVAAHDDCLQREQLPLWFEHVRKLHNPVHAAYLQALLITGARREELAGLRWQDVDFQWKAMTIRDKVEGERTIPLTPYVAALLFPLPRRTLERDGKTVPNPHVFSSPTAESGRLREPRISHKRALTAAGLPNVTLHGLRRSFGTLAEWCEVPVGIVAQIQGHKPSAIAEKHYRRRSLDLLRQWHAKIEAWILEQAGIEQSREDVQPLRAVK